MLYQVVIHDYGNFAMQVIDTFEKRNDAFNLFDKLATILRHQKDLGVEIVSIEDDYCGE